MSVDSSEMPYVARYGVAPTRAQFEAACQRLEDHLAALKRLKLEKLGPEDLRDEYVRYHEALRRFELFLNREVSHFMRDWWRIDPIEDVDRVRRRANRQRNLSYGHFIDMRSALLARGPGGIEAIKEMFLMRDNDLVSWLYDVAVEHFPDDAEPVLEELLTQTDDLQMPFWRRERYEDALKAIRGYRERRARALAPELSTSADPGMAPSLATIDRSPAEYPELLFEHFAAFVFSGEYTIFAAVIAAWKQVVAEKRLDPAYHEQAELAGFDSKYRDQLAGVILTYYGNTPYPAHLVEGQFEYRHADGSTVTLDELRQALYHVVRMSHSEPYLPAKEWTRSDH